MSRYLSLGFVLVLILSLATGCQPVQPIQAQDTQAAQQEQVAQLTDIAPEHHLIFATDAIQWQEGPGSIEPGAQIAVLEGNPSEAAHFTLRLKFPDGYQVAPHWHDGVERITVISGVFRLGSGEELNAENTVALEAGSYTSMPPGMRHFVIAEGETIVQLSTIGPWVINYVNPEDDPRTR